MKAAFSSRVTRWAGVFLVVTFSSGAFAAGESRLSQKPVPLQTEAYALFSYEDIVSYEGLVGAIRKTSDDADTPGGRLWQLLPPLLREELEAAAGAFEEKLKYEIIDGLNGVIRRRDMYTPEAFSSVEIDVELRQLLEGGLTALGAVEATSKNRRLLTAAFPEHISPSQVPPFPKRPRTYRIFGDDFLNTGNLQKGVTLPGGAVWQPSLLTFGTFRSAWQYQDSGDRTPPDTSVPGPPILGSQIQSEEWVNRLDLFFNLYLTQTERIVLGLRPIDEDDDFSGYAWQPDDREHERWEGQLDADIEVLFFEGDFGELFPKLDRLDRRDLDIGFSVGRQPLFIQEGMLINDVIDGVGITRNNNLFFGVSNVRITAFWGWQNINRGVGAGINKRVDSADLFGLFTQIDSRKSTFELDIVYVDDDERIEILDDGTTRRRGGDQLNVGFGAIQRLGKFNTAFRVNHSFRMGGDDTIDAAEGTLLFGELSWTPDHTLDIVYASAFWANDNYKSAARDPLTGGPLGRTGILFDAFGIGNQVSPIDNTAFETAGGALGYQRFFGLRKHIILEAGGRSDTDGRDRAEYGIAARWQQAISNRYIWRLDAYYVERTNHEDRSGFRSEIVIQF